MPEIEVPATPPTALMQFVKFCVIGLSSAIIDIAISRWLTYGMGLHWVLAKIISFSFAVTNGFIWNSIWTFRGMGSGKRHEMYVKFVTVNVVGLGLNIAIMKTVFMIFTGKLFKQGAPDKLHWTIATLTAIFLVAIWNFMANRRWTFKHPETEMDVID